MKHTVDARTPVGTEYLTEPARNGGRSLLQRFHASWNEALQPQRAPQMRLITDREIDPADRAMRGLDRRTELLVPEFGAALPRGLRARHGRSTSASRPTSCWHFCRTFAL